MPKQMLHLLCIAWAKEAIITENDTGYLMRLKKLDHKVLSTTARPTRRQEFMNANKFFSLWFENNNLFIEEPPEVALVYTKMTVDMNGVAYAIPLDLACPIHDKGDWIFQLTFREQQLPVGSYEDIALFIDWLPTLYCPKSIKAIFSELGSI